MTDTKTLDDVQNAEDQLRIAIDKVGMEGTCDPVRDVAGPLNAERRIERYVVESENVESIHNHSAYALVERDKRAASCQGGG